MEKAKKMRVLNLYSGLGGNRKLWTDCDVTAVEMDEETAKVYQDYFPDDQVIVGDAHQYLLGHYDEYDFIWSSPPCPTHSDIRRMAAKQGQYKPVFPDMKLYQEIIFLKGFASCKWVVENVVAYYDPLIPYTKKLNRHWFWCNFKIGNCDEKTERKNIKHIGGGENVFGFTVKGTAIKNKRKALRNMVDPKLGQYIFNCAREIYHKSNTEQTTLFAN